MDKNGAEEKQNNDEFPKNYPGRVEKLIPNKRFHTVWSHLHSILEITKWYNLDDKLMFSRSLKRSQDERSGALEKQHEGMVPCLLHTCVFTVTV